MLKTKIGPTDGSGYYVMTRMNEDTIYRGRKVPGKTVTHVFLREGDRCIYTMLDHASCENRAVCAKKQHDIMCQRWEAYYHEHKGKGI